jgi:hypothetical protein
VMREAERTVAAQLVMRIKILGDNEINNPSFCRCYFFFFIFLCFLVASEKIEHVRERHWGSWIVDH